jgi:hypothetical protein
MVDETNWLAASEDFIRPLMQESGGTPLCMLIGAGASLSAGGPYTAEVVEAVRSARPGTFPDAKSVYERGHEISIREIDTAIKRLFNDLVPNIGYRCLAVMARERPIAVVNLNWDDCIPRACDKVGLSAEDHRSLHLDDVDDVHATWTEFKRRGRGLLSVHPHGLLATGDLRFATKKTLKIKEAQLDLLRELMRLHTIVVGTSLSGPHDVTDLLEAMRPQNEKETELLWVLERGDRRREPGIDTPAGRDLRKALDARESSLNFVAAPEVDFDMFMTMLRATEVGLSWDEWTKEQRGEVNLPALADLVMPNPMVTRKLLDAKNVLLTGRAEVGKSVIANLLAHWHAILAGGDTRSRKTTGFLEARNALGGLVDKPATAKKIVICDDCLSVETTPEEVAEMTATLRNADGTMSVVMTSGPTELLSARTPPSQLDEAIDVVVLEAADTWTTSGLRQYARHLGAGTPEATAALIGQIDRCELTTPIQVKRAHRRSTAPPERYKQEQTQLCEHVEGLCRQAPEEALLLALMRMQDLSHPHTREELLEMSNAKAEEVLNDPWDLASIFQMDQEYLRLSDDCLRKAVDRCIEKHRNPLRRKIAEGGQQLHWAITALEQWDVLHATTSSPSEIRKLTDVQREMFGPQLVENAIDDENAALDAIETLRELAHDEWALKDVALVLLEHWHRLERHQEALALRDRFLADGARYGTYALFEGLLRRGGWAPPELWHPVQTRVLDMARGRAFGMDEQRRRRHIALSFDALLWRTAPAEDSQHRILLRKLLDAATDDSVLRTMFAVAVAYHYDRAVALKLPGLDQLLGPSAGVTEDQAQEMAWLVAWHFVHQSRNRAVASRRFFNSTHTSMRTAGRQRLLDRHFQERELPEPWASQVKNVVQALGRWKSTAGWGLHLMMNIHATAGTFVPDKLEEIVQRTDSDDQGLIAAAIAYVPAGDTHETIKPLICSGDGRRALLAGLGNGVLVNGVRVISPRFLLTHDEWKELRKRWGIRNDKLWRYLGHSSDKPHETALDLFEASIDRARELGAEEHSLWRAIDHFRRGDTRAFDAVIDLQKVQVQTRYSPYPGGSESKEAEEIRVAALLRSAAVWLERRSPR